MSVTDSIGERTARGNILASIRAHLAASVAHEHRQPDHSLLGEASIPVGNSSSSSASNVHLFKLNLDAVDGHCIVAQTELEVVQALARIISDFKGEGIQSTRVAVSDAPGLEGLVRRAAGDVDVKVLPQTQELFDFAIGVTTAQAAIAETGTLVLDGSFERHRLISLVPPVHIAIVEASRICSSLGEALSSLRNGTPEVSPVVTLITGPSRTGDIELTLTIGVHGPQKLYVIVKSNEATDLTETI